MADTVDALNAIDDKAAAAAFRRLVLHLRHRTDAQNVDLMGLAGFCRNCLSDWVGEAAGVDKATAREAIYGMPYDQWKAEHQVEATPEQLARMAESVKRGTVNARLSRGPEPPRPAPIPTSAPDRPCPRARPWSWRRGHGGRQDFKGLETWRTRISTAAAM
ncbi:hypothetical protein QE379_003623 [Sphingomonas sp. SORGH_AS 879]|nr:hypothetical protein [Sphingomonas sp. SORGH_AS_0879]